MIFQQAIENVLAEVEAKERGGGVTNQNTGDHRMADSGFRAFGQPVPSVRADDVRRVWSFLAEQDRDTRSQGGVAVNLKLLADLCQPNANVLAVYMRAILVNALMKLGRLDRWRERNSLPDSVFELAARFPLPQGPSDAGLDAFVNALQK